MNIFTRYFKFLATWRKHREAIKQLNRLTDRELADVGITRHTIDEMVWLDSDKQQRGSFKEGLDV